MQSPASPPALPRRLQTGRPARVAPQTCTESWIRLPLPTSARACWRFSRGAGPGSYRPRSVFHPRTTSHAADSIPKSSAEPRTTPAAWPASPRKIRGPQKTWNGIRRMRSGSMVENRTWPMIGTSRKTPTSHADVGSGRRIHDSVHVSELHERSCPVCKRLGSTGGEAGACVAIYTSIFRRQLQCSRSARIGAVHSVVFGGFSATALADRIADAKAKILITADGGYRRGKIVPGRPWA